MRKVPSRSSITAGVVGEEAGEGEILVGRVGVLNGRQAVPEHVEELRLALRVLGEPLLARADAYPAFAGKRRRSDPSCGDLKDHDALVSNSSLVEPKP